MGGEFFLRFTVLLISVRIDATYAMQSQWTGTPSHMVIPFGHVFQTFAE